MIGHRRRLAIGMGGVAAVLVVALGALWALTGPTGLPSALEAAAAYASALEARSADGLRAVASPEADPSAAVREALASLGEGPVTITRLEQQPTESTAYQAVDLTGTVGGRPYARRIWLRLVERGPYHDTPSWYVVLRSPLPNADEPSSAP